MYFWRKAKTSVAVQPRTDSVICFVASIAASRGGRPRRRVRAGGAGDDALSGAVIITTKRGVGNRGVKVDYDAGSFGYQRMFARAGFGDVDRFDGPAPEAFGHDCRLRLHTCLLLRPVL